MKKIGYERFTINNPQAVERWSEYQIKKEEFDQNPYHFDKIDDKLKSVEKSP